MKKKLLIALLTFTPFFISARPSNAELLAHLKNVRIDIKKALQETYEAEERVKAELGLQAYTELTNKWNADHDATVKELEKRELEVCFDQICKMNSMHKAQEYASSAIVDTNFDLINLDSEIIVDDMSQASITICWITSFRRLLNPLLEQIETKIKELEQA